MSENTTKFRCPQCSDINEPNFIYDSDRIDSLGFISSNKKPEFTDDNEWAPHGLCTSTACIDEWCKERNLDSRFRFGVPLVPFAGDDSDVYIHDLRSEYDCEDCSFGQYMWAKESKGFVCNNPNCASIRHDLPIPEGTGQTKGDKWQIYRSRFLKALENRRGVVDPPYKFEKAVNPFVQGKNFDQRIPGKENQASKQKSEQSWIECQLPLLMAMKDMDGTAFRQIVLTTYIHKTFSFRHIEPLWMFAKRAKLGGELSWAFRTYEEKDHIFSELIDKNLYALENNRSSIHCVYELIKAEIPWPTDRIQDDYMISKATEAKEKFEQKGIFNQLKGHNLMNDEYSLNGRLKTPIGLIECICIINALHHHSGIDNFAKDVREGIFPTRAKSQYWKDIMGDKSEPFVEIVLPKLCLV